MRVFAAAVAVERLGRLAAQVKCLAHLLRRDHLQGPRLEPVEPVKGIALVQAPLQLAKSLQQRLPIAQPIERLDRRQVLDRIAERTKRSMPRAGVVRLLIFKLAVRGLSQAHIRRQRRSVPGQSADHRAKRRPLAGRPRQSGIDLAQIMIVLDRLHAPQEGQPIHDLRLPWKEPHTAARLPAWSGSS